MNADAKPDSGKDAYTRDRMQLIGRLVDEELPQGWGFVVLAFPFGDEAGRLNYVANGAREDVIKVMKEFIAKTEASWGSHT